MVAAGHEPDVFEAAALGDALRLRTILDDQPALAGAWSADGFTPLHLAAFLAEDPAAALLLINRGADTTARARHPMAVAPLNSAAARGRVEVVRALLDAGAHPDTAQTAGFTALHAAAARGSRELAELLLSRGADPARETDDGRTAAAIAEERGHAEVAEFLRRAADSRA
jgi:uncharacterized protein